MQTLLRAWFATAAGAVTCVGVSSLLGWLKLVNNQDSRKIMHIVTGPVFILFWRVFPQHPLSRYVCASVPLLATLHFLLVGLGYISDPALVAGATRTGQRRELLQGPLAYGILHAALAAHYWRDAPHALVALAVLCGGDGFAALVGRRFTSPAAKLPYNRSKSYCGSAACFLGAFAFTLQLLVLLSGEGWLGRTYTFQEAVSGTAFVSAVATAVESLPWGPWDNVAVVAAALWASKRVF